MDIEQRKKMFYHLWRFYWRGFAPLIDVLLMTLLCLAAVGYYVPYFVILGTLIAWLTRYIAPCSWREYENGDE